MAGKETLKTPRLSMRRDNPLDKPPNDLEKVAENIRNIMSTPDGVSYPDRLYPGDLLWPRPALKANLDKAAKLLKDKGQVEKYAHLIDNGRLVVKNLDVMNKNLEGLNMGALSLKGCSFQRCAFNESLSGVRSELGLYKNCTFTGTIRNAQFSETTAENCTLYKGAFKNCSLDMTFRRGGAALFNFYHSDMGRVQFDGVGLQSVSIANCNASKKNAALLFKDCSIKGLEIIDSQFNEIALGKNNKMQQPLIEQAICGKAVHGQRFDPRHAPVDEYILFENSSIKRLAFTNIIADGFGVTEKVSIGHFELTNTIITGKKEETTAAITGKINKMSLKNTIFRNTAFGINPNFRIGELRGDMVSFDHCWGNLLTKEIDLKNYTGPGSGKDLNIDSEKGTVQKLDFKALDKLFDMPNDGRDSIQNDSRLSPQKTGQPPADLAGAGNDNAANKGPQQAQIGELELG